MIDWYQPIYHNVDRDFGTTTRRTYPSTVMVISPTHDLGREINQLDVVKETHPYHLNSTAVQSK